MEVTLAPFRAGGAEESPRIVRNNALFTSQPPWSATGRTLLATPGRALPSRDARFVIVDVHASVFVV